MEKAKSRVFSRKILPSGPRALQLFPSEAPRSPAIPLKFLRKCLCDDD